MKIASSYKYQAVPVEVDDEVVSQEKAGSQRTALHNCAIFGFPAVLLFLVTWMLISFTSFDKEVSIAKAVGGLRHHGHTDKVVVVATSEPNSCAGCAQDVLNAHCSDIKTPVLGGLDFVDFYENTLNNGPGVASAGSESISTVYNDYTFYFKSTENKEKFLKSPETYIPQYGGFCAWGIAGEFCPEYPWAADCLGPSGDWTLGYKFNDQSYFFYKAEARDKFLANPTYYAKQGAERWTEWFGSKTIFSTNCYVDPSGTPTNHPKAKISS